jgi:starvation-inducible DNA-binding protein
MQSTKNKIESYPAPAQLATETDLSPHEIKAITEAVNPLIADAFALYVKTKNFPTGIYMVPISETIICYSMSTQMPYSIQST